MAYRIPYLQVLGPDEQDMLKVWGSALIGVRLVDRVDGGSDESIFNFTRKRPYLPIPGQGTPFTVRIGWSKDSVAVTGRCTFQRVHIFGNPKQGQRLQLICRAGDFNDGDIKKVDSQHFDTEGGNRTLGDVFNNLFKSSGQSIRIHPDIAKMPLAGGYALRWNQSAIDFANDLAENVGAILKPMDGKILVLKRGSLESVSGQSLPTIQMPFDENYSFDFELEPRFDYAKTSASWLDTDKGTLEREDKDAREQGPRNALPHPFSSKEGAKQAAEALSAEWKGFTGTGFFTKAGDPTAVAGAAVACSGFGTPIDETKWEAEAVIHDVDPDPRQGGWITSTETRTVD